MGKCASPVFPAAGIAEVQPRAAAMTRAGSDERPTAAEAQLRQIAFEPPGREAALFVTYPLGGQIRAHVRHYVESLARAGIDIYLLVMTDQPLTDAGSWLRTSVKGLFLREHKGTSFAAWTQLVRHCPDLSNVEILYLADDSLLGPTNRPALHATLDCIRDSAAEIVGLTDSFDGGWLPQGSFLAMKRDVLSSFAFQSFIRDTGVSEGDVDDSHEVRFASLMKSTGFAVDVLFRTAEGRRQGNGNWRELLAAGLPFVDVPIVQRENSLHDGGGWRDELRRYGYDVALAERFLADLAFHKKYPLGLPLADRRRRISFVGTWRLDDAHGAASRGYLRALMHADFETRWLPIETSSADRRISPDVRVSDFAGPADVAVLHLDASSWNEDRSPELRDEVERAFKRVVLFGTEADLAVGELSSCFEKADAVWTSSRFAADLVRSHFEGPIDVVPQVVPLPGATSSGSQQGELRRRLGIPEGARVMLGASDRSAGGADDLVRVFAETGLAARNWVLVSAPERSSAIDDVPRSLVDPAIPGVIAVQRMTEQERSVLLDIAEIYASSHCLPGFNPALAQAMARGNIVVVPDYGGSRDYLDSDTGFPVRCEKRSVDGSNAFSATSSAKWSIDAAHLAGCLKAAADLSSSERAALAVRARAQIEQLLSPRTIARRMEDGIKRLLSEA